MPVGLTGKYGGGIIYGLRLVALNLKLELHGYSNQKLKKFRLREVRFVRAIFPACGLQNFADGVGRIMFENLIEVVENVVVGGRSIPHYEVLRLHLGYFGNG